MPNLPLHRVLRQLHSLGARPESSGLSDAQLLERFATRRDEAAFEVLVWRHGTMVFNVCQRVLRHSQEAEDAFQACFLVLVRKARSISRTEALAGWLYRVAWRIALRARDSRQRQAQREPQGLEFPATVPGEEAVWRDLRAVLDEEIQRLPVKYRLPVIYCYLSGLTTEEAARQIGCPRGTILSRLAWARAKLRVRLARRGVALPAGVLALLLAEHGAATAATPTLVAATVYAARLLAAGTPVAAGAFSARAVTLMEGALRAMFITRVRNSVAVCVALLVVAATIGFWANRPAAAEGPDRKIQDGARPAARGAEEARAGAREHESLRPLGTWERIAGDYAITLRFEADHVYATMVGREKDKSVTMMLEADYSLSKENILYGIITSVEIPMGAEKDTEGAATAFLDYPFSIRFRLDDNALTIKDLKFGDPEKKETDKGYMILLGRYKKKVGSSKEPGQPSREPHGIQ